MLATPHSTTYEGEELDHCSHHGSPTSGGLSLAPSLAHHSAPVPRGWSPSDAQQMGFQHQPLRNAPTSLDVDAMVHHDVAPIAAGLRNPDHGSPLPKQEVETPNRSEGGSMRHSSRTGQQNGEEASKVNEPYAKLIHRAFMSRDRHVMTLQDIYQWFRENTEKGKSDNKGWQNSIRHNLSMNRAFGKRELKSIMGEPLAGLKSSKKLSEWYLMPWAINGVQSTTRYRTKGSSGRRTRAGSAHQCGNSSCRAISDRQGGLAASKSKAKKASQDQDLYHRYHASGLASGSNEGDTQMGTMDLDDAHVGLSYGISNPLDHGPTETMMLHSSMQAAVLPVSGSCSAHSFAYPAPDSLQYGQNSSQYHAPHNMYSLEEVPGLYQGQLVPIPHHAE